MEKKTFILASGSPSRENLLKSIGFIPDKKIVTDVDETPMKLEKPKILAQRLAKEKLKVGFEKVDEKKNIVILAGDSVVALGRRIIDKALTDEDVKRNLEMLSDRSHRVYTGFSVLATDLEGNVCFSTMRRLGMSRLKRQWLL